MSATASAYGFKPVNLVGSQPFAGATRQFLIDPAGYAVNIFNGSLVYVNASGYLNLVTATGADGTTNAFPAGTTLTGAVGVFVGCSYYNAQGQLIFSQYYPASTTGVVKAMVVDDPDVILQVQANGAVAQAKLGENVTLANAQSTSTGSTVTGNSNVAVSATSATTTLPFRVVGFVDSTTSAVGDAYTDVLVKWNPGWHAYNNVIGL
jgi:hypothetical protein